MTLLRIAHLCYEAAVLAGAPSKCHLDGHKFVSMGGRGCPFHKDGCGNHSQTVYQCDVCGEFDYGDVPGSRAYDECADKQFNCGGHAECT